MDLDDVIAENFFKKMTYSSDPNPENKIVMSNGAFAQCAIMLKIVMVLESIRGNMK